MKYIETLVFKTLIEAILVEIHRDLTVPRYDTPLFEIHSGLTVEDIN